MWIEGRRRFNARERTRRAVHETIGRPLAEHARALGAKVVIVHGETIVEPVPRGTNLAAIEAGVDILADALRVTLGPRGRKVILDKMYGTPDRLLYPERRVGDRWLAPVWSCLTQCRVRRWLRRFRVLTARIPWSVDHCRVS